jgi:outer membrane protein assembly factor BamB
MTRIAAVVIAAGACSAADWLQFRGPNGSGVGNADRLPIKFGPQQNVVWKTSVPFGHSSPVIAGNLIFLTAVEDAVRANVRSEKPFRTRN